MLNAYLLVSYDSDSGPPWLALAALRYEVKVNNMLTLASQHHMFKYGDIINREAEVRDTWRTRMIREKCSFNDAVEASIESNMWPCSKDLKMMAQRQSCSKEFTNENAARDPPPPQNPKQSSSSNETPAATHKPPPYKGRPARVPPDPTRDFDRWKDKRHTICQKWQQGQCKYSADECNRAHGNFYLRV